MRIDQNDDFIINRAYIHHPDFITLLLLKIKLSLKYENKFVFLSVNSFSVLKLLLLSYFSNLKQSEYESAQTIAIVRLLFSIGTKVYNRDILKIKTKGIEVVKLSLLSTLQDTFLSYTGNFWLSYFDSKFLQSKEKTTKLKAVKISKAMLLYNFFINKDFEVSCRFVEDVVPVKSIDIKTFEKDVLAKIGRIIYKATNSDNKHLRMTKLSKHKERKITDIFVLIFKKGFVDLRILNHILLLNKKIGRKVKKYIIHFKLHKKNIADKYRFFNWLEYIKPSKKRIFFLGGERREIDETERQQIRTDVLRTKVWKGEDYQLKLENLILDFLSQYKTDLQYFQGFNYIASFFFDHLPSRKDALCILDYLANHLLNVG